MNKRVLIIFPDEWVSHSPTILNLVRSLKGTCSVKVITFDDGTFGNERLKDTSYAYIKVNHALARLFLRKNRQIYGLLKSMLLLKAVRCHMGSNEAIQVIGVDSIGLWVAQKVFGSAHFLSLEIKNDFFFRRCKRHGIRSLVIQTEERAHFLFGNSLPKMFFIQNSPFLPYNHDYTAAQKSFNGKLIFLGNILPEHGIFTCLDAVEEMAAGGITLTLRGVLYRNSVKHKIFGKYGHLIKEGAVTLEQTYVDQDGIIDFLTEFSIGFCLYDFSIISKNDFNYLSSPSGKLFNYYAAGVPVIGTDILGLRSVKDFEAGVLLPEPSVQGIKHAVRKISTRFDFYRANCLKAAKYFNFADAVGPYRDFLTRSDS